MLRQSVSAGILFVVGLFLILVAPSLFSEGMFVDGSVYASISRNLSVGKGSIWDLYYTDCLYPQFNEHPPLAFLLQSVFYSLLGTSLWIERSYSLLCFVLIGVLMYAIWRVWVRKDLGWLPLLFFVLMPLVPWCASNNMLENTMAVFDLAAVALIALALINQHAKSYWYLLLAGGFLLAAFLTKGFTGLYPLIAPGLWALVNRDKFNKKIWLQQAVLVAGFVSLLSLLFWLVPESFEAIERYVQRQVLRGLTEERTTSNRLYIVFKMLTESLIPLGLILILWVAARKKVKKLEWSTEGQWLLWLGLSGVLPMMVSIKQSGYYILPALPLIALSLATIAARRCTLLFNSRFIRPSQLWIALIVFVFGIGLNVYFFGQVTRDRDKVELQYAIKTHLPEGSTISTNHELIENWGLVAYLQRYNSASLCLNEERLGSYYLSKGPSELLGYQLIFNSGEYFVYQRVNP